MKIIDEDLVYAKILCSVLVEEEEVKEIFGYFRRPDDVESEEEYAEKVFNIANIVCIYEKYKEDEELTIGELKFIYEIDNKINCPSLNYWQGKSKIEEILKTRDKRKDLAKIFNCKPENIALTEQEALKEDIIYHYEGLSSDGLISYGEDEDENDLKETKGNKTK